MASLIQLIRPALAVALATFLTFFAVACGGTDNSEPSSREAPVAAEFPSPEDKTIEELYGSVDPSELVVAPVGQVFDRGDNRYGFAVFEVDRTQVLDADVAMYFAHADGGEVVGPLPARVESMETKPAFAAMTTSQDDDSAKAVYVVPEVKFDQPGEWVGIAMIRGENGLEATRVPSPVVDKFPKVPKVGDSAPRIATPTPESVGGDLTKIDTRIPPTDMHTDFAKVVGKKPVVLLFATPQLCQSRVCGPVVDVEAQVQAEMKDEAEYIHMEIFKENDPNKGVRPQVSAFGLPSEPWLFVIDSDGVIQTRIEGAFGLGELREAVRAAGQTKN